VTEGSSARTVSLNVERETPSMAAASRAERSPPGAGAG
jgi:hypothetical protein